MKIRDYKFSFNLSAFLLFVLIMAPNIVWFCVPSANDILRDPSKVPILDTFVTVSQVIMLAALCILKNKNAGKLKISPLIILSVVFCLLYYACWVLYYCNVVHGAVLIGLSVFPCLSYLVYGIDRKNYPALIPIGLFTILHFISTMINFI